MNNENIKAIVTNILKAIAGKKADKVLQSIEEHPNGILVYLSHGLTLGDALDVQDEIKKAGLQIPEQMGNAVIYVTASNA